MRLFFYFLLSYLLSSCTFAAEPFNFLSKNYLINRDGTAKIVFSYDLSEREPRDFRVRPHVSSGTVYIKKENEWIDGQSLWAEMPLLKPEMLIKITSQRETDLGFTIQDIKNGKNYIIATKKYYPYNFLYQHSRNLRLKTDQNNSNKNPPLLYKMIEYVSGIF